MSQAATKSDLTNLGKKVNTDLTNLEKKVNTDLTNLEKRVNTKFIDLEERVNTRFEKLESIAHVHAQAIAKVEQRIENIENTMATKNDIQRVLNHIDAFAGQIQDYARKAVIQDYRFNQLEPQVQDHEKRIISLES